VADPPSGHVFDTASQKSRTGFRLALTEATTAGTPLVCSATTVTPPRTCPSVAGVARRWKMIRIRPTAVIPTISTATTMVNQATAGMGVPLSVPFSAEQFADRAGVAHRARSHGLDRGVGRAQRLGGAVQLADQGHPAGQDVLAGGPDPLQGGQHPVE